MIQSPAPRFIDRPDHTRISQHRLGTTRCSGEQRYLHSNQFSWINSTYATAANPEGLYLLSDNAAGWVALRITHSQDANWLSIIRRLSNRMGVMCHLVKRQLSQNKELALMLGATVLIIAFISWLMLK